MSTRIEIAGAAFVIDGDVNTDTIIKSHLCTTADSQALAPHCLAELDGPSPFRAGTCSVILCSGTFGIGSARIQAPLALAGAGVEAVIARAFAPMFFENCINGAMLLPLTGTLPAYPATGCHIELAVSAGELVLCFEGERVTLPCSLPEWTLAGRGWMDLIEEQVREAGDLEALRARGLSLR
jgi:3-isopropylmalate dehydratase small subunit